MCNLIACRCTDCLVHVDMYDRYAEYSSPPIQQNTFAGQKLVKRFSPKDHPVDAKLPLEDLILIPAVLYGFSLGDRQWREYICIFTPILLNRDLLNPQ